MQFLIASIGLLTSWAMVPASRPAAANFSISSMRRSMLQLLQTAHRGEIAQNRDGIGHQPAFVVDLAGARVVLHFLLRSRDGSAGWAHSRDRRTNR